jgi:hypothetical protein
MRSIRKRVFTHKCRAGAVKSVLNEGLDVTQEARKLELLVKTYSKMDSRCARGNAGENGRPSSIACEGFAT